MIYELSFGLYKPIHPELDLFYYSEYRGVGLFWGEMSCSSSRDHKFITRYNIVIIHIEILYPYKD